MKTELFIDGTWTGARGRERFDVEDPASLHVVASVVDGGEPEAVAAVDAAVAAAAAWADTPPRQRSDLLMAAWSLMTERSGQLVELISTENGKSRADAAAEVAYAGEFLRWYAEEAVRPSGTFGPAPAGGVRTVVSHRPVGVAALVTPWNFPAAMITRKVGPALAAGCTVVLKPAAETPLTALALADVLQQVGVPDGVVNVVTTTDPGAVVGAWLDDPRVRKLSFTGSTGVGRQLLAHAARRVVNTSMELGGNAPFVVTAGADLASAVEGAMVAKFRGGGQACTAANRFLVHADVHDEFVERLSDRVGRLTVGPAAAGAQIGPVITASARRRVERLVVDAVAGGARAIVPHDVTGHAGHFVAPTVLVDVAPDARVVQEEIFGPVAPVVSWRDEEQMLSLARSGELGLAGYVFDRDLGKAISIAERLDVGMVGINRGVVSDPSAPFGGVKQSGIGREGARVGLEEYLESTHLSIGWPDD